MVATLALAVLLNGPVEPRLAVHLSIDQDGGLSALQLQLAVDELRAIWSDAGVAVSSGRYGEPSGPDEAVISMRILLSPPRRTKGAEPVLAWVIGTEAGRSAPLLFVSLPAVTVAVMDAVALGRRVNTLTPDLRHRLVARAIGRVTAHELGHYLLHDAGHQHRGLMRASYPASELVESWVDPFKVPAADRPVVRQSIAALARLQAAF
jgi:hypothetical protein